MKSILTFYLLLIVAVSQAQTWPQYTLRSNIRGAWSRSADFDQDGDPDILLQSGDSIYWYENLRPGWTPHLIDPTFFHADYGYVSVLDLDQDGDTDVLKVPVSNTGTDTLSWNENQANATVWVKHTLLKTVGSVGWMDKSYGDLDQDGDLDLVIPEYDLVNTPSSGSLYWLENTGNNTWEKRPLLSGNQWYSSVADLDDDGDLDIAAAFEGVYWLENKLPDTSWPKHGIVSGTFNGNFLGVCHDMNADGKADILSVPTETNGGLNYFMNPGWQEVSINNVGQNLYLGAIGDIDDDGDPDITYGGAGYLTQSLGWAENQNNGASWVLHDITPPLQIQMIPTGLDDIDGDGDTDIVSLTFDVASSVGSVFWAANPQITTAIPGLPTADAQVSVHFSPNPFFHQLTVSIDADPAEQFQLRLYDSCGRLVLESSVPAGKTTLDVAGLPAGMYQVGVSGKRAAWVGRGVKG